MVERCFNKLKHARRPATSYDKPADGYPGLIHIVSIRRWTRESVNVSSGTVSSLGSSGLGKSRAATARAHQSRESSMKRALSLALATALGALAASPAAAQSMSPVPAIERGNALLTVNAEGRSTRLPELAIFSAGVTTQAKTAGEALADNSRAMNKVVAELKRAGIAARDIQTSNLSINPVYSQQTRPADEPQTPVIVAYQVSNQVSIRQRKLGDYGKVIDTLVSAGANQVNGPSFQLDNSDAALDEARIAAMKAARARAELYAKAAGLRVARIVSISEGQNYQPGPPMVYAAMRMDKESSAPPVESGELELTANVTVMFELAP